MRYKFVVACVRPSIYDMRCVLYAVVLTCVIVSAFASEFWEKHSTHAFSSPTNNRANDMMVDLTQYYTHTREIGVPHNM